MSRALLDRAYADRDAIPAAARQAGRPVVGLIGADLPREIVLAAGGLPIAVTAGERRATPTADIYLDDVISPEDHDLFEAAVEGRLEGLDLLVLSRPYQHLFYFLKEIYRLGRAPKMPPIWLFDLLPSRREAVRTYNAGCLALLKDQVERACRRTIGEADLRAAIGEMNAVRERRRRLENLRAHGQVTGTEALRALGAALFMAPSDYVPAMDAYLAAVQGGTAQPAAGPGLLVVSAEPLSKPHLHEVAEAAGARVLAEDDVWGSRSAEPDIPQDGAPLDALLDAYWLRSASRDVYPPEEADRWFAEQLQRPAIDGVVFYLSPSDRKAGWDYPRLAARAAAAGKRALLIRSDVETDAGRADAAGKLRAFVAEFQAAAAREPTGAYPS